MKCPEGRLLRAVRKPREMKPDDGRRNRGPHTPEHSAAIARGVRRAKWIREQRDLAFGNEPHVAIPTALWLRGPVTKRREQQWPPVECVPCWQRDRWRFPSTPGPHIEGQVPE